MKTGQGATILDQLAGTSGGAGQNRLRAMVKATDFEALVASATSEVVPPRSPGVGFRFRGSKNWNGIEIFLDEDSDTYTLRFLPDAAREWGRHGAHHG